MGTDNKDIQNAATSQLGDFKNDPTHPGNLATQAHQNIPYWQQQVKALPTRLKQQYADINKQAALDMGQAMGGLNRFSASPGISDDISRGQQAAQMMGQAYNQRMTQANTIADAESDSLANQMALEDKQMNLVTQDELQNTAISNAMTDVGAMLAQTSIHDTERFAHAQTALEAHSQWPEAQRQAAYMIASDIITHAVEADMTIPQYLSRLAGQGTIITNPHLREALQSGMAAAGANPVAKTYEGILYDTEMPQGTGQGQWWDA